MGECFDSCVCVSACVCVCMCWRVCVRGWEGACEGAGVWLRVCGCMFVNACVLTCVGECVD